MAGARRGTPATALNPLRAAGVALAVVSVLVAILLASCSGGGSPKSSGSVANTPSATPLPTATAAPLPSAHGCYLLAYDAALKPTSSAEPVDCGTQHTDRTFFVGRPDNVVNGHLLAVDSARVTHQMATECPRRFASYVGGSTEQRRLSMLSVVWFGPTLKQSDQGQSWFRCDAIALASAGKLAPLTGKLDKVLDSEAGRTRWGRCATGKPGSKGAVQVLCSTRRPAASTWRAVATLDIAAGARGAWPGAKKAAAAGAGCENRVRDQAADPLSFSWGYEPPTEAQWTTGQHYGFCWSPIKK
jgi:hypothetical protein